MKHIVKLLAAAAILATTVVAPATAQDDVRIVVVSHGQANDPFWSVVKNGVTKAAEDMNISVDYRAPESYDMVVMAQLIDAAVSQEPDGLIVSIPDADALGPAIERAVAAGISVISMNSGSDVSKGLGALLHVGQEEYDAGLAAGPAEGPRCTRRADLVQRARDFVIPNLSLALTADEIARSLGVSLRVLNYAFQSNVGISVYQYFLTEKLHAVRRKLQTSSASITEASMSYGFSNPSRFSGHYKRLFGELPTETRNQQAVRIAVK